MTGSLEQVLPDALRSRGHARTTVETVVADDADAARLREAQQAELAERYGEPDAGTFTPEATVANLVVRADGEAVACVAVRDVSGTPDGRGGTHPSRTGEIKRLYVEPAARGRGFARIVMRAAHEHAAVAGLVRLVLETGTLQPESIDLYLSLGYVPIESYGHYAGQPLSRCFALDLGTQAAPRLPGQADAVRPVDLEMRAVPWDDPDARTLRREMHERSSAVLYPELFVGLDAAGGYEAADARLGADVVTTLVAFRDGDAVGCASLRRPAPGAPRDTLEVKKVFVREQARRTGTARALLTALDVAARALGARTLLLETGIRQPGAISLYRSLGYRTVLPFPPYDDENAVALCFAKSVR
jgi:GNAT superfamily N-acetyltransferase